MNLQVRLKHGWQGSLDSRIIALSDNGGVYLVLVEPKIATIFVFTAAAICISPESLQMISLQQAIKSIASVIDVLPVKDITLSFNSWGTNEITSLAVSLSFLDPNINTLVATFFFK